MKSLITRFFTVTFITAAVATTFAQTTVADSNTTKNSSKPTSVVNFLEIQNGSIFSANVNTAPRQKQ